jgi:phospho-acceptor domain-containing protein
LIETEEEPNKQSDAKTRTEILYGADNIVKRVIGDFHTIKERLDNCTDFTGPSVFINTPVWKEFIELKNRGIKLRFITEITNANISYCKELMTIAELRHLDGVKGNFGIADGRDYGGAASVEEGQPPIELIRSNVKTFVEQQQYFFETLWSKSIPAKQKIREIEEGTKMPIRTWILENQDEIINEIRHLNNNANRLSICSVFGGMQMSYKYFFSSYQKLVNNRKKGEDDPVRWIVNIDSKDNLDLIKTFLNAGMKIRHVKSLPPMSFGFSDKEIAATIEKMEGGRTSQSFLFSNEPLYIDHFNSIFEELWRNGVDAQRRIEDIEADIDLDADIDVIPNTARAHELYYQLVRLAKQEILLLFPTINAFTRQVKIVKEALLCGKEQTNVVISSSSGGDVQIRILMPSPNNELAHQKLEEIKGRFPNHLEIRHIESLMLPTQATILIVDRIKSLVMEIKDDTKMNFDEAIGLSTFSSSMAGVLSYVSIFENLWKQIELYEDIKKSNERLKIHDRMQREFINIAAHELRTPIQPILGLSQILLSKTGSIDQYTEFLDVINRNAKRLNRLTDDILDATKIESKMLDLKREQFNINDIITNSIDDITMGNDSVKSGNIPIYTNLRTSY